MGKHKKKIDLEELTLEQQELTLSGLIEVSAGQLTVDLYKQTIADLLKQVNHQKKVIEKLNKKEIKLRDKIAAEIYVRHYDDSKSPEAAAKHAYDTADVFLRLRENGNGMPQEFELNPKPNEKSS